MKDLFNRISNTLKRLKNQISSYERKTIIAGIFALMSTLWIAFMVILNIIYFPYPITYALFVIPGIAVITSTILLVLNNDQETTGLWIASNIISHTMTILAVLATGNLGIVLFYGLPLLIQTMSISSIFSENTITETIGELG